MVHAIRMLKCKKGHILPITYDDNKCGCHHDGKPCIIVSCRECLEEAIKNIDSSESLDDYQIYVPLDKESQKEIEKLL